MVDQLRATGRPNWIELSTRRGGSSPGTTSGSILHEFLPLVHRCSAVDDILVHGRRFYHPGDERRPSSPSNSRAPRIGSATLARPRIEPTWRETSATPFFGFIFDPAEGQADPADLRGGARANRRFVGWQTFFDFGDGEVKPRKLIDTRISTPLFNLPLPAIASGDPPTSLPQRNLLRHQTWELPSGQRIANAMRLPALPPGTRRARFTALA